jgi:hypothetical protein
MSHIDMGIVGATTDTFILFENGVRRNWCCLGCQMRCATGRLLRFNELAVDAQGRPLLKG